MRRTVGEPQTQGPRAASCIGTAGPTPRPRATLVRNERAGAKSRRLAVAARHGLIGAGALLCPACTNEASTPPLDVESGQQGASAPQPGSTSAAGPTDADSDTFDDEDPAARLDIGTAPDVGLDDLGSGCTAVDFLFVIDNSVSMEAAQYNIVANFPTFIEGIQSALEAVDSFHVGITTSDRYVVNTDECRDLGSLVVQTARSECGPYSEGGNFMTEADDLAKAFACAARVGTYGSGNELPMAAMENAINGILTLPGRCNEGFLRDDALLVVVVLTDEWDGFGDVDGPAPSFASAGNPSSWYQTVVNAKGGLPENAVAVVLTNYEDGPCPPSRLYPEDPLRHDGRNLVEFAQQFGANGFVGGICEPDYGPIFAQVIDVIDEACASFIPPG